MPTLGIVPHVRDRGRALAAVTNSSLSAYAEAINNTLIALHARSPHGGHRVIAVSSALPNEGKTMFAAALARAAATAHTRTLLIDCDMRRPSMSRVFEQAASPGLESMFTKECADVSQFVLTDQCSGLHYLSTSGMTSNPHEILGSHWISELLARARAGSKLVGIRHAATPNGMGCVASVSDSGYYAARGAVGLHAIGAHCRGVELLGLPRQRLDRHDPFDGRYA